MVGQSSFTSTDSQNYANALKLSYYTFAVLADGGTVDWQLPPTPSFGLSAEQASETRQGFFNFVSATEANSIAIHGMAPWDQENPYKFPYGYNPNYPPEFFGGGLFGGVPLPVLPVPLNNPVPALPLNLPNVPVVPNAPNAPVLSQPSPWEQFLEWLEDFFG